MPPGMLCHRQYTCSCNYSGDTVFCFFDPHPTIIPPRVLILLEILLHLRKCSGLIQICSGYVHAFFLDSNVMCNVVTFVSGKEISSHFQTRAYSCSHFWTVAF